MWWSADLLREVEEIRRRQWGDTRTEAVRRTNFVRAAFPAARVDTRVARRTPGEKFVHDPDDAHVAAVALCAAPCTLVTRDRTGFKVAELKRSNVLFMTPDNHLLEVYQEAPSEVLMALSDQLAAHHSITDLHELLSSIYRCGERRFAEVVCREQGLPPPAAQRRPQP